MQRGLARVLAALGVVLAGGARAAATDDWPGWRGPERTDVSKETGLLKEWPDGGPRQVWKATGLGGGFSTPAVVAGKIYLLGSRANDESVVCLNGEDGSKAWSAKVGRVARAGYEGTRSTPTIDGTSLYALSSDGDLVAMDTKTHRIRWQKNLKRDFGGQAGGWAYTESPLIDGDTLVCTPGGKGATIVALNKKTGRQLWKASVPGNVAAYSSAIVAQNGATKEYIQFLSSGVVGVDAKTGKLLWKYTESANGTANIPTPIYHDGYVFSASGYGKGGGLIKLAVDRSGSPFEPVYFSREMVNQHGGIVLYDDHLYGTNERTLLCLDFQSGKVCWQDRSVGKGSITCADGHLYVRSENGPVALVEATPDGYHEKGRFNQPDRSSQPAWPHPVVAGGRLYLRDQDILLAYDIKAK